MPFWKTDLTGRALVIPRAAWDDQHAASLECALPMDEGPSNRHGFVGAAQNTDVTVTAVPAPTLVTGQNARFYGSCCSFTSSGLTVTFVDRSLFGAPNSNFTMETWVRVAETGDGALFTLGNVSVAITGSTIVLCGDTSAAFTRSVWAHVAVVRNGSTTVTLFVNGVPVCTSSPVIAPAISTVAAFGVACLASDMRLYSTAKYAANFASSFVPTVVPASDITRITNGTTVSIGVTPSTYRTMRVYAGFADPADPAGPGAEVAFSERAAVYAAPSGITCTFASPVYTLTGTSVSVTTTGFTATAPGNVTIFASKTSGDTAPAAASDRTALSATGAATVALGPQTFTSAGTWYVYARFSNADGLFGGSLVAATSVTVTDYALPTVSATTTSPVPSQMVAGTPVQCTVTLTGSNYTSLAASNIAITIGTVAATGLSYVPSTGVATFTLTSPSGGYDVTLVITPLANSLVSSTTVIRSVFVDNAAGFTYPTSMTASPGSLMAGTTSTSVTLTLSPAPNQSAQYSLFVGPTPTAALAATAITGTVSSAVISTTVPAQTGGQVYVLVRIVSPSLATGPVLQALLPVYVTPTAVSYTAPTTYTMTPVSVSVTATGVNSVAPGSVEICASKTSGDQAPVLVSARTALSATGTATVTTTFPTAGTWYVIARWYDVAGAQVGSLVQAPNSIAVTDHAPIGIQGAAVRTFKGATYVCIRRSMSITVPADIQGEALLVGGGGGGGGSIAGGYCPGGGGGAGGVAYVGAATIRAGTYTVGVGGQALTFDPGKDTTAFGITVYGGGMGAESEFGVIHQPSSISEPYYTADQLAAQQTRGLAHNGGSGGGSGTGSGGIPESSSVPATGTSVIGTYVSYGTRGGKSLGSGNGCGGGGGAGAVGKNRYNASDDWGGSFGGNGGIGLSTWSDWCAACGIGEAAAGSTEFYIAGGGGGASDEPTGARTSGYGGLGGGGMGGRTVVGLMAPPWRAVAPSFGPSGYATPGLNYAGGGGGGGESQGTGMGPKVSDPNDRNGQTVLDKAFALSGPGRGGCGVVIIKAPFATVYTTSSPTSVAGLRLWLDGSDPNGTGTAPAGLTAITTWYDKSSSKYNATQYVAGRTAKYMAAGTVPGIKPTLGSTYFSGSPYKIAFPGFSPSAYTIICVFRADVGLTAAYGQMLESVNSCYVLSGASDYQLYFGMWNDAFETTVGAAGVWYGQSTTEPKTFVNRQWVVATMQYNGATKTTTSFLNGISMTAKGPDALTQNSGAAWTDLYIGQKGTATGADFKMQGYIGDILIYNSVLGTSDRMSVEAWLSEKYGFGVSV